MKISLFFNLAPFSTIATFSEQWCKKRKVEFFKKGFPAALENMPLLGFKDY